MKPGTLHVVATPIGNLGDLSPRARETLASVALIAAEDTRHTGRLLAHFGIRTPLLALHEHNESERIPELIARLRQGESVALVSDAGTPLVSDPGFALVRAARNAGLPVSPVPGPCAAIAALSVAGLPSDRFVFEGFLPARAAARRARLEALAAETRTLVFYEAPHRLRDTLADLVTAFGEERPACAARELTKLHETTMAGTLAALAAWAETDPYATTGEIVLVVGGAPEAQHGTEPLDVDRLLTVLLEELPIRRAAALAAKLTGRGKNELYRRALTLTSQSRS
ncbi:MAG TPA: 16S rRNA (cytidine(1402)-2'-O)-methyltransferase [Gammaproteobacteria bacterium]|nr:16S rRNA (cytidine(1402)-2'-O)-methyltransferase [Gammaproteobacteria bacterium]